MDHERTDSGEFAPTVTPERVLAVFDAVEGPAITSSDVAAKLDCTAEAARRPLDELHEDGRLARRRTALLARGRSVTREVAGTGPRTRQAA